MREDDGSSLTTDNRKNGGIVFNQHTVLIDWDEAEEELLMRLERFARLHSKCEALEAVADNEVKETRPSTASTTSKNFRVDATVQQQFNDNSAESRLKEWRKYEKKEEKRIGKYTAAEKS